MRINRKKRRVDFIFSFFPTVRMSRLSFDKDMSLLEGRKMQEEHMDINQFLIGKAMNSDEDKNHHGKMDDKDDPCVDDMGLTDPEKMHEECQKMRH
ncbi:unnamed protein product [Caenorhabditis auriculariae]|uniref:Uncharacterized protein n=1 Tax=Caenorhabditis auriculariae TaxID=2777116 RepID=A0A8S1H848_9PELO|nr:unnamed protein product [Caenorhabditis auriculariae]